MAKALGRCLLQLVCIQSDYYIIILTISQFHWSLPHFGNKPKKFDFVHKTVSPREGVWSGHETIPMPGTSHAHYSATILRHAHACATCTRAEFKKAEKLDEVFTKMCSYRE